MTINFDTPLVREVESLLYERLQRSENGILGFYEILNVFDMNPNYSLNRVSAGAIHLIRERENVVQLRDNENKPYLKLRQF